MPGQQLCRLQRPLQPLHRDVCRAEVIPFQSNDFRGSKPVAEGQPNH